MMSVINGEIPVALEAWLVATVVAVVVGLALLAHAVLLAALGRLVGRTSSVVDNSLLRRGKQPARLILIILGLLLVLPGVEIEPNVKTRFPAWLDACLTAAVGWQGFTLTGTIHDVVAARYDLSAADNLAAREVHTRVRVLQRILDATRANIKAFLNGTPQNIVT
jgi:hypothetical protein